MKKHVFLFLLIVMAVSSITAQDKSQIDLQNQFKINYNIVAFEGIYELPIAKEFVLDLGLGFGAGNYIKKDAFLNKSFGTSLSFKSFPSLRFKSSIKYIYNRIKRAQNNKNNKNNAGNYLEFQTLYTTKQKNASNISNSADNTLLTEMRWGMQRSLGGNWLFNVHFGIGYGKDFETKIDNFYPALGLSFSYIIFKK
ncbi:hypothetical protein [Tenacibaculum sp. UWU-22]|uniref:hypothetical protein n=1 Tax=Tenacibaculum sp. UWU-22 TaxID=3234187 RepID=UPI0034DAF7A1